MTSHCGRGSKVTAVAQSGMRVDTGTKPTITSTNFARPAYYNSMEKCPGGPIFLVATVDI